MAVYTRPVDTPCFPQWRPFLAPLGRHTARLRETAGATGGLAALFGRCFPGLLVPARHGPGSRRRAFGRVDVFWAFLAQVLTRDASCRWALDRLHAEALAAGRPRGSGTTSAYCQARAALPLPWLQSLFAALERWLRPRAKGDWHGRAVRVIDGTAFSMPDTPRNRRRGPSAGIQTRLRLSRGQTRRPVLPALRPPALVRPGHLQDP